LVSDFTTMASAPIYADRTTGETFADAVTMVNAYLARFAQRTGLADVRGGPPTLDPTGFATVLCGSATIGVNVLDAQGVLMMFAPLMKVPLAGREAFFRRLLELSFVATSDAAFAIDGPRDEVVVRSLRRLSALDYEEFEDLLNTVGEVADAWDDALVREYGP
jgi:hypothetical protein